MAIYQSPSILKALKLFPFSIAMAIALVLPMGTCYGLSGETSSGYEYLEFDAEELSGYEEDLKRFLHLGAKSALDSEDQMSFDAARASVLGEPAGQRFAIEMKIFDLLSGDYEYMESLSAENRGRYRRLAAQVVFRIWRRGNQLLDPNFDPSDRPAMKVCPPRGTNLPCGVGPEAVDDPQLKRSFLEAIAENEKKSAYYRRQTMLRDMLKMFKMSGEIHLAWMYSMSPSALSELEELAVSEVPDERQREDLMSLVRNRLSKM